MLRKLIASVAFMFVFSTTALGQYRATDGYWYFPGYTQAYTQHYNPGYWNCGIYYYGTPYYVAYNPPYVAPVVVKQDFDTQLLNIVRSREAEKAKVDKLRAVGITLPNEALLPLLSQQTNYNGGYNLTGHIYQNLTPFVNTYNTSGASFYKDTDINQLMALQFQGYNIASQGATQANGLFSANVQQVIGGQARIAEINAKKDAYVAFMQYMNGTPTAQSNGYKFSVTPANGINQQQSNQTDTSKQSLLNAWVADAKIDCAKCHVAPNPQGGFDLDTYPAMSEAERRKRVYPRIDPKAIDSFRMPRNADGSPGIPFSPQRLQLWQMVQEPNPLPMPTADQTK